MSPSPSARRGVRLIMVSDANNNKFYEMVENADGTFTATYGRIGAAPATCRYPLREWDVKYREKVRKGYTDVSSLRTPNDAKRPRFSITDPDVRALFDELARASEASVRMSYLIGAGEVSARQLEEAQAHLDELSRLAGEETLDASAFNARLLSLYTCIPRRMSDVRAHLLGSGLDPDDRERLRGALEREQQTLDVMEGEVRQSERSRAPGVPPTLEEALGLTVELVADPSEREGIQARMGEERGRFRRAFRVVDPAQAARFEAHVAAARNPTRRLLWHGSRNENWLSILEQGLRLRPARAVINGKMFGFGLYFAEHFAKSLNYTSIWGACWTGGRGRTAFLGLYEVHLGRALRVRSWMPWCASLDAATLAARRWRRYDSVHGAAGLSLRNDEFVVYEEAQATVRYLVEVAL